MRVWSHHVFFGSIFVDEKTILCETFFYMWKDVIRETQEKCRDLKIEGTQKCLLISESSFIRQFCKRTYIFQELSPKKRVTVTATDSVMILLIIVGFYHFLPGIYQIVVLFRKKGHKRIRFSEKWRMPFCFP